MKTRAVITVWRDRKKGLLEQYVKNMRAWHTEVDTVYILDSGWGFTHDEIKLFDCVNYRLIHPSPSMPMNKVLKWIKPLIKEDKRLYLKPSGEIKSVAEIHKIFESL